LKIDDLEKKYKKKIVSPDQLIRFIGEPPRLKSVIQCHGTFDLVHPGHIRHLMYAKNNADILVVSITPDRFIEKANYRPFVPEQLRALNLAALDAVDFVIIDDNSESLELIKKIKPDFFAKGYDYDSEILNPKTAQEQNIVEEYGGKLIFTPGDVVYSSSRIIETSQPDIALEKLRSLISAENTSINEIINSLKGIEKTRVHVIGDTIVDTYVNCSMIGSSTSKTPTLSTKFDFETNYLGGAAIVATHLAATGAKVEFSSVVGNDVMGKFVIEEIGKHGIGSKVITESNRPTTNKFVYISNGYKLLKVDKVDNRPIEHKTLEQFSSCITNSAADVTIFSDFRHGIFSKSSITKLSDCIKEGTLKVADSQVASRWGNVLDFKDFDLITPNEKEARFSLGDQDSVIRPLGAELFSKSGTKLLILKMGERGIMVFRDDSGSARDFFQIDSFAKNTIDPVGAGDALLAYSSVVLRHTKSALAAGIVGSIAAAIACEKIGNTPVAIADVLERLKVIDKKLLSS
jgi:rfaE bifunctional protein kinase chain/domain/rfaE bifunctional protein nucleotidyltransferase chain/domain